MTAESVILNPSSWLVWVVLLVVCTGYAALVRWLRNHNGSSQTAWLVVAGNIIVMLAATLVVALITNIENAIVVFFVMFLSNAFGGVPMIIEYVTWYHSTEGQRMRTEQQQLIARIMDGD